MFCALAAVASAKGIKPAVKVHWQGHNYLLDPDYDCWSQHEVAQATWPNPSWVVKGKTNSFAGAQMRVRGQAGDRTNRNYLVINLKTGRLVRPDAKYFRRADPFTRLPPMPPPSLVVQSSQMPAPAVVVKHWSWQACDDRTAFFRFYTSTDAKTWTVLQESDAPYLEVICNQAGPHFFGIKAVSADGQESGWGHDGACW
jgi:hypothetical protein